MANATLRTLLDQRAAAWSQVQDIQARRSRAGYEPTDEDGETYTRALDDVERIGKAIEDEERADRLTLAMNAVDDSQRSTNPVAGLGQPPIADEYRDVFGQYLRSGEGRLTGEQQRMLEQGFVTDNDIRALAAGVDTAGGYTVPAQFLARLTEAVKSFGGVLGLAEVINSTTGAPLSWPTNDDTSNKGAILAENTQVTEQDMVFGSTALGAHMYTSKMVRVSRQLLQDTAFDLEAWLAKKLGTRIGRAAAEHFVSGTGIGQPKGLLTGLTQTVETAGAGKIGYDDLVDLEHSIDPAYRAAGSYLLADSAVRAIRKLKDTTGRPLWAPALAGGTPSTINGQPYTVDNSFPTFGEGAKPIVYGDIHSAYVVRVVSGAQTLRLSERYADYLQVGFLGFQRLDGTVQDTSAATALVVKSA